MKREIKINVRCFNLKYTLECGQCFRWHKIYEDNEKITYVGVIHDRVVHISQVQNTLIVSSSNMENIEEVIRKYFDLDVDYEKIENKIAKIDKNIENAVKNSTGIRILNQDFFEMVISYIISANNNIKRISRSVEDISKKYGKKIMFCGRDYYLFPTIKELELVTEEEYKKCGVGFRARYLKNTVKYMLENKIDYDYIKVLDTVCAKRELMKMQGVGQKVADCILLFSLERREVFPIDVWVERVMSKIYFKELNGKTSKKEILDYAINNFDKNCGIVQQHLFYNIRESMI